MHKILAAVNHFNIINDGKFSAVSLCFESYTFKFKSEKWNEILELYDV